MARGSAEVFKRKLQLLLGKKIFIAWMRGSDKDNVINGFRVARIYSWDLSHFDLTKTTAGSKNNRNNITSTQTELAVKHVEQDNTETILDEEDVTNVQQDISNSFGATNFILQ